MKDPEVAVVALRAEGGIEPGEPEKQFLPGLFSFFRWSRGVDLSAKQLLAGWDGCLA